MSKKIKCCQIHLMPAARDRAARALFPGGGRDHRDFTGPDFNDIRDAYCSGDVATVICLDGTVYVYPMHQVARFKLYEREVLA